MWCRKPSKPCDGRHSSPIFQPISERFRLVAIQMRLEEKIFVPVTCVIGRSLHGELLHSRTAGQFRTDGGISGCISKVGSEHLFWPVCSHWLLRLRTRRPSGTLAR